jgi:tetratricopeptide (TPR) repeat protein
MRRFLRVGRAQVLTCSIAALVAVATPAVAQSAARSDSLDELFTQLKRCNDADQAALIEHQIWQIWRRSGVAHVDSLFDMGLMALGYRDFDRALAIFTEITDGAPNFAEGWNKLASVRYLRGEYDDALVDVDRALALERRHFGAITGRAMVLLVKGDAPNALRYFEQALALNPLSRQIREQVERLRGKLGFRSV